ncbi:unnamed protein product [Pleuronectes platessa]|uniref:Uncharacterized protein n=1 Tax=Pleuronectes platessa TaxID=8262 RepID=A0A9N7UF50_PLEPL|nr:unnamed protein product [Pleuronectes platessa]
MSRSHWLHEAPVIRAIGCDWLSRHTTEEGRAFDGDRSGQLLLGRTLSLSGGRSTTVSLESLVHLIVELNRVSWAQGPVPQLGAPGRAASNCKKCITVKPGSRCVADRKQWLKVFCIMQREASARLQEHIGSIAPHPQIKIIIESVESCSCRTCGSVTELISSRERLRSRGRLRCRGRLASSPCRGGGAASCWKP